MSAAWCALGIAIGIGSTLAILRARIADLVRYTAILDARREMLDQWEARLQDG